MNPFTYKIPQYQWANPFMYMFEPGTVQTVGNVLPPIARYRPYYDEQEVFDNWPNYAKHEGAQVAIFEYGSITDYTLWYWYIDRTNGEPNNFWALKRIAPLSDEYEITFRLMDTGPGWNGSAFSLPPLHTIVKVCAISDFGISETEGIGFSQTTNDLGEWPEGITNLGYMYPGYTNQSGSVQTIYYNAQVSMEPNYRVIVTISRNPFDRYPNL